MRLPPGPNSPLPLVGDLPLIGLGKAAGLGPQPHVRMTQLAREHGDVMSLRMGSEAWVVLSSPEMVHEAFVECGDAFAGRPMVPSMSISSGGGKGYARPSMTPELRLLRKTATTRLFSASQVERSQRWMEDEARRLSDHLVAQSVRDGDVAIRPALRRAVCNMVIGYTFSAAGVPYEAGGASTSPPNIVALAEVVDEIWAELTATPTTVLDLITRQSPGGALSSVAHTRLTQLVAKRDRLIVSIVDARKAQRRARARTDAAPTGRGDMLDALLDSNLPDDDVHYALVDNFVAGTNTVSAALEWMLLLGAAHPLEQERTRAAVRRELGAADAPGAQSTSSAHVDALVCETMRFKPPLLLPRTATRDASIGGFTVRRGTVVLANNHALTSDPRWWRDPHVFRPSRFLDEEATLTLRGASGGSAPACKFIPFSVGQRVCPGSRLAIGELQAATRVLLSSVRWRRAQAANAIDLSEAYGLTLMPAVEQRLRFERVPPPRTDTRVTPTTLQAQHPPRGIPRAGSAMMGIEEVSPPPQEGESADRADRGRQPARATRRQKARNLEEAADVERLKEAGTDRRGGWRASKAKGNRRNRRYEKRLLSGVAGAGIDL